jgi:hypothetical protein
MKTIAKRIMDAYGWGEQPLPEDVEALATMVLQLQVLSCGTCQESNLINKPELIYEPATR